MFEELLCVRIFKAKDVVVLRLALESLNFSNKSHICRFFYRLLFAFHAVHLQLSTGDRIRRSDDPQSGSKQ